jgi:hypothetical protein
MLVTLLLSAHLLVGVALLGAVTHQAVGLLSPSPLRGGRFIARYAKTDHAAFTVAIATLFAVSVLLGGVLYPSYRLHVRISFEELSYGWAIGLFELKEHFGGIGIGLLPAYIWAWRSGHTTGRVSLTLIVAFIAWWNFLVGHVLNNLRGLT